MVATQSNMQTRLILNMSLREPQQRCAGYASALSLVDTLVLLSPQYNDTLWVSASTDDGYNTARARLRILYKCRTYVRAWFTLAFTCRVTVTASCLLLFSMYLFGAGATTSK
jgi:hypothetical protein